jgi:hypothetical protein
LESQLLHKPPDVFDGVQFRRFWWQWQDGDVFGGSQVVGHVPSGLVHYEDGVGVIGDVARYLDQMLVDGIAWVSDHGMTRAAALPCLGQIAPNMYADRVRWSCGADGLDPRFAQCAEAESEFTV